jgi:two-component system phosphate regulon sensor histidine kinase PhoR
MASATLLALLGGSLVLMLVALRRARELAHQQMEFVATISHELRTPGTVFSMTGANLADGLVRDPEQVRRYGRLIQRESRRLNEMTEQVLSLARIECASVRAKKSVAMAAVIERAVQAMQPQIEELGFSCHVAIDPHLPPVLGDATSLERAIENLIGNALKYYAEHREIRITTGTQETRVGTRVWIAVADRGIGIEANELPLIFEPFRRGRAARERNLPGTGLGLNLVLRIMQTHDGHVHVRSEPGAGSIFTLDFPAAEGRHESTPTTRAERRRGPTDVRNPSPSP